MANEEHVAIVKRGAKAIAEWREANPGVRLDLSKTDLSGLNLNGLNLSEADLSKANLSEADLSAANLRKANLHDADLIAAQLMTANLHEAELRRAILAWTNLSEARLNDANIESAECSHTLFCGVDLSTVKGLVKARHNGPSKVDIDTLYKSNGNIPSEFLRGCGVPDSFIDYIPALIGAAKPFEFYSCFISHATKDKAFCNRLHDRMQREHLSTWYAPHDVQSGKKLYPQIDEAIRLHDKLLLVMSKTSINSEWVKTEIRRALKKEKESGKRVLFPISVMPFKTLREWECVDTDSGRDMAEEVREYFIPDFRNWKDHDEFEKAFARLLEDLKKEDVVGGGGDG